MQKAVLAVFNIASHTLTTSLKQVTLEEQGVQDAHSTGFKWPVLGTDGIHGKVTDAL